MDYHELPWGQLKSFAKSQDINTKGLKRIEILEMLDSFNSEVKEEETTIKFKGIKELPKKEYKHPLFKEVKPYLPHLKAYKKLKATSAVEGVSVGIATLFMKHIETDKNAAINLKCGRCISRYYERMVNGYNILAEKYGEPTI